MTTIGITGHTGLTDATVRLVSDAVHEALAPYADEDLIGISCLARGSDQIFAEAVLACQGRLKVIIPAADYAERTPKKARSVFDSYVSRAMEVQEMPHHHSGREAYFAASQELIDQSDVVLAIWDGGEPDGRGGTADAVAYARQVKRPIVRIWPLGAERA